MSKRIDWHIGLQKTGTSTVQIALMREGGPLEAAGIDWLPGAVGPGAAHHNAAWEAGAHKRFRPALPGLPALLEAIAASPAQRIFVSSEDFGLMAPDRVADLGARLDPDWAVTPRLVLRNPLDFAESLYAQAAKQGRPGSFADFAERLATGGRLRFDRVRAAWEGLGPVALTVYEDHDDICAALAREIGVTPPPPGPRHNRSLNERFVALALEIRAAAREGRLALPGRPAGPLPPEEEAPLARALLRLGAKHERFRGSPVFLPRAEAAAFLAAQAPVVADLARHVDLPERYHRPDPDRREPLRPEARDREALMDGLADMAEFP